MQKTRGSGQLYFPAIWNEQVHSIGNDISIICIPNNRTIKDIELWLEIPYQLNIIRKLKYTENISTSDIIKRIQARSDLN